jgi:hypothetical protein
MSRGYSEKVKKHFPGRGILKWCLSILAAIAIWPFMLMLVGIVIYIALSIGLIGYMAYRIHDEID